MSVVATIYHNIIKELERLSQDPDPFVKDQAEQELQTAMNHIKLDMAAARHDNSSSSSTSSENKTIVVHKSVSEASKQDDSLQIIQRDEDDQFDDPDLKWEHERPKPSSSNEPQEVHIRMPNVDIYVRPFNTPDTSTRPRTVRNGEGAGI
jgi:hypothetical protein